MSVRNAVKILPMKAIISLFGLVLIGLGVMYYEFMGFVIHFAYDVLGLQRYRQFGKPSK